MKGEGRYEWVDLEGQLRTAAHWDALPAEMDRLVRFEPECPPPPHTEEDHAAMATFDGRLHEALARCRR